MKCNYCVHNIGENFIYCGLHLPIPVKPVAANIFANENKVMFLSEFQKYNKSFRTNLENAVKKQIAVFNYIRQLNLNLAVQQYRNILSNTSNVQKNNGVKKYHSYRKRRR